MITLTQCVKLSSTLPEERFKMKYSYHDESLKLKRIYTGFKILLILDFTCILGLFIFNEKWIAIFIIPVNIYLFWLQVINYSFAYSFTEDNRKKLDEILGNEMSAMDVRKGFANCEASYYILGSALPENKELQLMNSLVIRKAVCIGLHLLLNFLILTSVLVS